MTGDLPKPRTWSQARQLAVDALAANLDFLRRTLPGTSLTDAVVPARYDGDRLVCDTARTRVKWSEQQYFLVPAGKDPHDLANRFVLDLHRFSGQRLFFTVPEQTRAMLRAAGRTFVQFFYVDNTDVQLKTRLMLALKQTARGPLVPALWQDRAGARLSPRSPAGDSLNPGQQRAFAAMTGSGAYFVWGPPGTGKTKVISAAVAAAIENNRKVLVASHTHVAVDTVLQKLMLTRYPVGTLIRVAGSSRDRVAPDVVAKGDLLLDQAAAILTRQQERLAAIEIQERTLDTEHTQCPFEVARLNAELDGVDLGGIADAQASVSARGELVELLVDLKRVKQEIQRWGEKQNAVREELKGLDRDRWQRDHQRLSAQEKQAGENVRDARSALSKAESELRTTRQKRIPVDAALAGARLDHSRTGNLGRLLGAQRRRAQRVAELTAQRGAVDAQIAADLQAVQRAELRLTRATSALQASTDQLRTIDDGLARENDLQVRARTIAKELSAAIRRQAEYEGRRSTLKKLASECPGADELLQRAGELGYLRLMAERDAENVRLVQLALKKDEVDMQRRRLRDDVLHKEQELLRSSPLIACTLTALTTQPLLAKRDFDVVIVDEVANANASAVLYAAAKATRTLALVGDFLQNAPIADADDPVTEADRVLAAWQRDDIFALAAITDRASAVAHPHCVALSRQYRYPSIIADVVNRFCYDGLLESEKVSSPSDGFTVTFVDTSGMDGYDLVREGDSWWSPGGIELMVALARHHQSASPPSQLGFVTPYAAQKYRAERRSRMEGLRIECGTAHTFQGREVPVLIFDLMQDRRVRWVGVADLGGGRREVSAAKLLNVAVTRMQQKIYLIGDWGYVRTSTRPGMTAIASLQDEPNFRVIPGRDVLDGSVFPD